VESVEFDPRDILRSVLIATVAIELAGAALLMFFFRQSGVENAGFAAIFHAVSAFANAGFSLFPDSLEGFADSAGVSITTMLLIVSGGLGFVVLHDLAGRSLRRRRRLSLHSKVVLTTSGVLVIGGAALYLLFGFYDTASDWGSRVLQALFQSVTTRTAGFNTLPQDSLSQPASNEHEGQGPAPPPGGSR